MPSETATAIAYVGAFVGLVGGGVALFNSWKAVSWKRAELANSYLKDFNNSAELVFAGRCLDWNGGKLVLPESLHPYMPNREEFIKHDKHIFAIALSPNLMTGEMDDDPRTHIGIARCALRGGTSDQNIQLPFLNLSVLRTHDL